MKDEMEKLIASFYSGRIDRKIFIEEYFKGKNPENEDVLKLLRQAINMQDEDMLEEGMALISTGFFSNSAFTTEFCQLLSQPWHNDHEDIASLLQEIASPATVECLYNAVGLEFPYLAYDDTYQFARKCIKALAAIGNDEAIDRLKDLSDHEVPEIANYAKKELGYKGFL